MVLNFWMEALTVILFGVCAYSSYGLGRRSGVEDGMQTMLQHLYQQKILTVTSDGKLVPVIPKRVRAQKTK